VGLIAFPGEGAFAFNFLFALISTLFLTAAYPLWKQVVTEVTAAQVEALEKLELA
jgi:Na+-translocating ferredoxin:NAD+ oxidoreductase RnfG subunit